MLNPPLSLLSDDLLVYLVENVADLPFEKENLNNLSLADRAFTQSCQKYIFRELKLSNTDELYQRLKNLKEVLDHKPQLATHVRMVQLANETAWLFNDPTFTNTVLPLLTNSPTPPHILLLGRFMGNSPMIVDPLLVVRWFTQSFFSQTLTVLHLSECQNIPLPLFLICPRLKEVILDKVGATEKSYDKYPDDLCSGRGSSSPEVLKYRNSQSLVKQIINPLPRFKIPVVLWSNLRILTLAPHDKEALPCLQPILDAACKTLEELYLTDMDRFESQQVLLAGLMALSNLPNLHVFAIFAIINCNKRRNAPCLAVIHDINAVLGTIPKENKMTNLSFDFDIIGGRSYNGCLDQDWVGMFNEIIRIADGKPLELELVMSVSTDHLGVDKEGQLYTGITNKSSSLSNHPEICAHFWNPTFWDRGIGPFPRGLVRGRCVEKSRKQL
ncbi:hypothetical protein M413DRAFT_416068 [Hebeloma cylindrosporum]|uniref:F-box domain-containing protein n=1 Tax=Hebeloma cylindrosporum TaxID=76867 RepID=A0A0C2YBY7_HEBCY|nr:hypothetical protein M413DRAFT_416068 [Hebeloma cylindrosporum h7]